MFIPQFFMLDSERAPEAVLKHLNKTQTTDYGRYATIALVTGVSQNDVRSIFRDWICSEELELIINECADVLGKNKRLDCDLLIVPLIRALQVFMEEFEFVSMICAYLRLGECQRILRRYIQKQGSQRILTAEQLKKLGKSLKANKSQFFSIIDRLGRIWSVEEDWSIVI